MFPAHQPKGNLTPIFGRCNHINNILKKLQTKGIKNESVHYKLSNSQKSFPFTMEMLQTTFTFYTHGNF